jgi:hypothetical protein
MCPKECHHPWMSVRLENTQDMGSNASHHQQNALSGQPMQEAPNESVVMTPWSRLRKTQVKEQTPSI